MSARPALQLVCQFLWCGEFKILSQEYTIPLEYSVKLSSCFSKFTGHLSSLHSIGLL